MKPVVWLPGAGGPAAIGGMKSLRGVPEFECTLITSDSNPLSAGFSLADAAYLLPPASSAAYVRKAVALVMAEKIEVVLPTSGFDIVPLSRHRRRFEGLGLTLAFSDYGVILLCNDKLRLFQTLAPHFPLPWTTADRALGRLPCVAKPVHGKGSRDIFVCHTETDLDRALASRPAGEMLLQEYLPGTEYSVDVLSDMDGRGVIAVPRVRLETRGGISSKGRVARSAEIERMCLAMAERLGLKGPTCFQLREDDQGRPRLIEINPRIGGGTIVSTLAGANLPLLTLGMVCGHPVPPPKIEEVVVLRYFEEVVWSGPPPEPPGESGGEPDQVEGSA